MIRFFWRPSSAKPGEEGTSPFLCQSSGSRASGNSWSSRRASWRLALHQGLLLLWIPEVIVLDESMSPALHRGLVPG